MNELIRKYQYLFYCFSRLTGHGHSFTFRVTTLLSLGTSFLLVGLFILVDRLLSKSETLEINEWLIIIGLWFGNWVIHIAYFQTGDRDEKILEMFEDQENKGNPKGTSFLYLTGTFAFFLFSGWFGGLIK